MASTTVTDAGGTSSAAARAGVQVRLLESVEDLVQADRLFAGIWGGGSQDAMAPNIMRALAHSGNYVAGAFAGDRLVGASVGFVWSGTSALHSHISGVASDVQGRGVGYALKLHQRSWAASRGIEVITWTFDPLVRRNGWFNLVKLGARAEAYHADFYGSMDDGINGGDPTDRCLVEWPVRPAAAARVDLAAAKALLAEGPEGEPRLIDADDHAAVLTCQVPADVVDLRRRDSGRAREWRLALRATMGAAMARGYVAVSITRAGEYVLTRRPA